MTQIFLSHSHRDADVAAAVGRELERLGLLVVVPSSLGSNENFRRSIQAAIKKSDVVVLLVASPEAASSSWIAYEGGLAAALGRRVLVLASHDYAAHDLPVDIASWQIISFDPRAPEHAAREIAEQLVARAQ